MEPVGLLAEFFYLIWHRKLWWLVPLMLALLVMGILAVVGESSALAPLLYPLF